MLAIIQARMSSQRLPGKVLRPMAGKPMLQWVHDRLFQAANLSRIVIATSVASSDDPVGEYCRDQKIPYYRGPLDHVVTRFLECAQREAAESFVRISGDSPLIDPALVDQAVALQMATSCDLATNVQFRSYPKGQSVEVIRAAALTKACQKTRDARDCEHVTRYFYAHPEQFRIESFSNGESMGDIQLSVDTLEDFQAVEAILQSAGGCVSWRTAATLKQEIVA